ncbi:unnamed protein product [Caretta caretta]
MGAKRAPDSPLATRGLLGRGCGKRPQHLPGGRRREPTAAGAARCVHRADRAQPWEDSAGALALRAAAEERGAVWPHR